MKYGARLRQGHEIGRQQARLFRRDIGDPGRDLRPEPRHRRLNAHPAHRLDELLPWNWRVNNNVAPALAA
ncbi:MAG: hypothetical protein FJX45_11965 [Alphaproteobacteria bacterium]|nr:hypothetical protein [Alphaproteobacteria bacterium]